MDCFEGMRMMKDKSVDVSFTSPPYNRIRNDTYDHYDDTLKDYYKFLVNVTDELLRITKGYSIVNIQQNMCNKKEMFKWIGNYSDKINGIIVWCKNNPQPGNNYREKDNTRSITNAFEYFFFLKDGKEFRSYGKELCKNYIMTNVNNEHFKGHGAVMKYEVAEHFIKKFTKSDDTVLDPFMELGTTALACKKNNRKYIGFEIVKEYYDMSIERLNKIEWEEEL